jgi:hypothetical protein
MPIDDAAKNERLIALSESVEARFWRVDFQSLSPPEQVFVSIWEVEAEVNNGGFQQYFCNSSGVNTPSLVVAFRAIGAGNMAEIAGLAIGACGANVPWSDHDARRSRLEALDDGHFDVLDEAFFAYPDNLTALLYRYVADHREQIAGVPADF